MPDFFESESVPTYLGLMNPTLLAIRSRGGSASNREIADVVNSDSSLPTQVAEVPHGKGGLTELEYRLYWARTYLMKYGLIENSTKGVWSLTSTGCEIEHVDPQEVYKSVRSLAASEQGVTEEDSVRELRARTYRKYL